MQLACFGYVTCFDADNDVCKACDDIKHCQKTCHETLIKMDVNEVQVKKALNKHNRWARRLGNPVVQSSSIRENFQVPDDDVRLQGLSKNAIAVARSLLHHEFAVSKVAASTVNQFVHDCPRHLTVFADHLMQQRFTTRGMIDDLKHRYSWTESTAKSYVSGFIEVLVSWQTVTRIKRGEYEVKSE